MYNLTSKVVNLTSKVVNLTSKVLNLTSKVVSLTNKVLLWHLERISQAKLLEKTPKFPLTERFFLNFWRNVYRSVLILRTSTVLKDFWLCACMIRRNNFRSRSESLAWRPALKSTGTPYGRRWRLFKIKKRCRWNGKFKAKKWYYCA